MYSLYDQNFNSNYLEYNPQFDSLPLEYYKYTSQILDTNLTVIPLNALQNEDMVIKSDWYTIVDYSPLQNSFEGSQITHVLGLELVVNEEFRTQYNFVDKRENNGDTSLDGVSIIIFNYSEIVFDDQPKSQSIFMLLLFDSEQTNQLIDLNRRALNPQSLFFLDKKPQIGYFELFQSLFSLLIVSLFYIGGLVAYAIFYRNALEEIKRKLF